MKYRSIQRNAIINIIQQVLLGLFPILTLQYAARVLGKVVYGRINFGISIIDYFILFASLGISTYAVREGASLKNDKEGFSAFVNELFTVRLLLSVLSFSLLLAVMLLAKPLESYRLLLLLQSMMIPLGVLNMDWVFLSHEDYLTPSLCVLSAQTLSLVLLFLFVKGPGDELRYAAVYVLAHCGSAVPSYFLAKRGTPVRLTARPRLRKHLPPMFVLFSNSLMISIYVNSDITLLGFLASAQEVGVYSVAVKIYTICKRLKGAAISVLMPRMSRYLHEGESAGYQQLLESSFRVLLLLIPPMSAGLYGVSTDMILLFGGAQFLDGVLPLRILSIALLFASAADYFSTTVLIPSHREKLVFCFTAISAFVNVGLNFFFIPAWGMAGAAVTTLIAEFLIAGLNFLHVRKLYLIPVRWPDAVDAILGSIMIVILCRIMDGFSLSLWVRLFGKVCVCVIFYMLLLLISKNDLILQLVKRFCSRSQHR